MASSRFVLGVVVSGAFHVLAFVQMHRAFNAQRANHYYDMWDFGAPSALNQSPLHAPSVFNFYHPNFTPAGPMQSTGLVGAEFEITNEVQVVNYTNFMSTLFWDGNGVSSAVAGLSGPTTPGYSVANRRVPIPASLSGTAPSCRAMEPEENPPRPNSRAGP